jgi:conjugative relaxase-like TrwC/TraI family protein
MLRITPSTSAQGAKAYFEKGLQHGDYYTRDQELPGIWHGRGAERLGLFGEVTREAFHALCENRNPLSGELLTPGAKAMRRVGYDFTFSVPKSVTLAHALTGDARVLAAFQRAVTETMAEIQEGMETRVRKDSENYDRVTGNLVYGQFVHLTSRPVDGVPDPHLHAHCYVFNATYDQVEERWKAGQFGQLKKDAPYYQAAFDARMALLLEEQGYGVERRAGGWELAFSSEGLTRKFSRRTEEIERTAEALGIKDDRVKDKIGARTRESKTEELSGAELKAEWISRLTADETRALSAAKSGREGRGTRFSVNEALDHSLAHSFERSSVRTEKQLLAEALKAGVGTVGVEELKTEFAARQNILSRKVGNEKHCTTREVLAEEREMIDFAREGRGACAPFRGEPWAFQDKELDLEQQEAVRHILYSLDRVTSVRGAAGVGKTRLMREATAGLEAAGHKVLPFAPSAAASRGVLREDGFKTADTVAQLLINPEVQERVQDGVIWIDEAGLLGAHDMSRVFRIAKDRNARVLLTGDTHQHAPVARGDALRILETHAGLKAAQVTKIHRQENATYKEAILALSEGRLSEGFAALESLGALHELGEERYATLARDFVRTVQEGKSALAVAPTHAEGHRVTESIRTELKAHGLLATSERSFLQYQNRNLTAAELADPVNYLPGQVVQFHQNAKKPQGELALKTSGGFSLAGRADGIEMRTVWRGFTRGEKLTVTGHDEKGRVLARDSKNRTVIVPLDQAEKFQLYAKTELELAAGDVVRMTKNGTTADGKGRFNNGAVYEVSGFSREGNIKLANGWQLPADFGHLTHGYTATSHASQGRTVDHVFIAQSTASACAATQEQFYVSASRGRKGISVYTDDKEELMEMVQRSSAREAASSLVATERERTTFAQYLRAQAIRVNRLAEQVRERVAGAIDWTRDLVERYAQPRGGTVHGRKPGFER